MARFQSKEEYERGRATPRGGAPPLSAEAAEAVVAAPEDAAPLEQVYDGPAPGSEEFVDRTRGQAGLGTGRDRNLAMLCHLTALLGFFIPLANILGPLVVWMIGKGDSQFVDEHGKSSLNFQISITLFFILGAVMGIFLGPLVAVLIMVAGIVAVYALVRTIVNGVKAKNGDEGEYALSTHFLK